MASSRKKRTGGFVALVVVLCLLLICVVAAAVLYGVVSRKIRAFQAGATFAFDYQITATTAEEPTLYSMLDQLGGTTGHVDGQYSPTALQLALYPKSTTAANGTAQPLTRLYINGNETLYDVGQLYTTLRAAVTEAYPLSSLLLPTWSLGSYISQTQLADVLGLDVSATSLQSMNSFALDLKHLQKVQPENAKDGYLYFQLESASSDASAPVLTLGVAKKNLLRTSSPAVHILLDIPAHGIHVELTGAVTAASTTLTAPTSRMQDADIASLVKLRETLESVLQFVQTAAQPQS